jgi:hypothetical protein
VADPVRAVALASRLGNSGDLDPVEFIGNYTAFHDLLRATAPS